MKYEKIIADRLKFAGVPVNLLGYEYFKKAEEVMASEPKLETEGKEG